MGKSYVVKTARGKAIRDSFNIKAGMEGVVEFTKHTKGHGLIMFYPDSGKPYCTCIELRDVELCESF